jgi:C4-dicarboxylate-specific signal transduction histidine kinase
MAAVRELNGLEGSELETEIARLEERMEGLISVLEVERAPIRYSVVELLDAVADSVPLHVTGIPDLALEVERDEATAIESDRNLLSVILRNALNNATDALTDLPPEDRLLSARLLIDESTFQLSIFNTTVARSVESEEASISGITTKTGHRGYGLKIMQIAARRLGYEVRLDISGGLASLTLRGPVGGPE